VKPISYRVDISRMAFVNSHISTTQHTDQQTTGIKDYFIFSACFISGYEPC